MSARSFQTWRRSGSGGLICLPPEPAVLQGKCHNATQRLERFWKNLPLYKQSHAVCKAKHHLSVPSYHCLSGPRWNSVTVHTKTVFSSSISKCLQKQNIKGSVFIVWGPAFFVLSAHASYLVLCNTEGASTSEHPPHPYQWLAFIWCHWKCMHFLLGSRGLLGGQRWESRCGKSIELKWTYLSVGGKKVCLLSCWIALEEGEGRTHAPEVGDIKQVH